MFRTIISGIIQGKGSANERECYFITKFLIDWAHNQDDLCIWVHFFYVALLTMNRIIGG